MFRVWNKWAHRCVGVLCCTLLASGQVVAQIRPLIPKLPYVRLDSGLAQMVLAVDTGEAPRIAIDRLQNPLAEAATVPVTISSANVPSVSAWLRAVGASVANASQDTIEAYVTADHLRLLNSLPGVRHVSQIIPAMERTVSQGVDVHNAGHWHARGRLGSGVKVGIVDIGFIGFSTLIGSELPTGVTTRCYSAIGVFSADLSACQNVTNHGTAVAESLLDIAPSVQLFIANPKSNLDFRQSIEWMTAHGVRVINYSVANIWDGPGDGTSPYSDSPLRTVDAAVAGGAVFLAAAGNEGTASYLGSFNDINGNNWAEFPAGTEDNAVVLSAGERISIQLRWQDTWVSSTRDLDLYLFGPTGQIVARSVRTQSASAGAPPFEFLTLTAPTAGTYHIGVSRYAGSLPAWIQLQNFSSQDLAFYTLGSIASPAESANAGVLAVAAAPWYAPGNLEWFSSRGPTPDGRLKPDVVGVDRADTVTYGVGGFAGTSQASPHIAGLAALIVEQSPSAPPFQVANYLRELAKPGYGPKPNHEWGYGLAVLPDLCTFRLSPASATLPAGSVTSSVSVLTESGCPWAAASVSSFLAIATGSSGVGPGTVILQSTANAASASRQGTLQIAGLTFTVTQAGKGSVARAPDMDWDGRTDLTVFRPSTAEWFVRQSAGGFGYSDFLLMQWGLPGDKPLAADFDGDGRMDLVVYRPSTGVWFIRYSSRSYDYNFDTYQWGLSEDTPLAADFDGDGKSDLVVYRPSSGEWYIRHSSNGFSYDFLRLQWGLPGDRPIPSDFDGDGRADLAVFRPTTGEWFIRYSTRGYSYAFDVFQWGLIGDIPLTTDFDGDGRTDLVVHRPSEGNWYVRYSGSNYSLGAWSLYQWGLPGDVPLSCDFDGDQRADLCVYRPNTGEWFIRFSSNAYSYSYYSVYQWGLPGDMPVAPTKR